MIHNLNISGLIADLATALADIITTTHYTSASDLIVTTTRSNKVIRFLWSSSRLSIYYGDAYVSSTTITNQVALNPNTSLTADSSVVIITGDLLFIGLRTTTGAYHGTVFGQADSATEEYLAFGWSTLSTTAMLRDTTNNEDIHLETFVAPIISAGGYYYYYAIPVVSDAGVLLASGIQGFKAVSRSIVSDTIYQTYGSNTLVSGAGARGLTYYFRTSFQIDNSDWTAS